MLGKFSVKKPYTVLVAVILVIVLGVVSFTRMTTDLLPNISLPYVIVMTPYPGASPETVEMVVTKPVESSMATVSNIEGISSVSSENYSMVILEFSQSTDMNAASLEIRENLDQIKSYWDDSVGNPIIMKLNPDMMPVMIAAVGGQNMTNAEITELTQNKIIPELESIEGVASASATGLLEESVNVIIRQEKIDAINEQVFGSIDVEIDEAKEELADKKQEVYDGQAELADARQELADSEIELEENRQKLEDSKKELEDSKKEIADGKAEIAENKTKLEEGKTELANKKEATTSQLAAAETEIVTAKADLEASKIHFNAEIATLKATNSAYSSALAEAENGLEQINSVLDPVLKAQENITRVNEIITKLGNTEISDDEKIFVASLLGDRYSEEMWIDGSASIILEGIKTQLNGVVDSVGQDTIDSLKEKKEDINSKITELETTISANENAITQMESTLSDITGNIEKLDSAMNELYQGNLTAAIEFANAQTEISLGELQITTAETQLEAGEIGRAHV